MAATFDEKQKLLAAAGQTLPGPAGNAAQGASAGLGLSALLGSGAAVPAVGGLAALGLVSGLLKARAARQQKDRELQLQADQLRADQLKREGDAMSDASQRRSATLRSILGGI